MSCNYSDRDETVLAYVRQELNPEAQDAFEAHYFVCEECASDVLFYEKTVLTMAGQGGIVFARSRHSHFEWLVTAQHFVNRWSENLANTLGIGGTVRAVAGYAVLILFLSASSFWLIKATNPAFRASAEKSTSTLAALASEATPNPASQIKSPDKIHLDWFQNTKLTNDPVLQARLDAIQPLYQVQKDYVTAGAALDPLANTFSEEGIKLYLAVCWGNAGRKADAIQLLETLKNSRTSSIRASANEVLAQLASNKK